MSIEVSTWSWQDRTVEAWQSIRMILFTFFLVKILYQSI